MSTKIFNSFKYYCNNFDDLVNFVEKKSNNFLEEAIANHFFTCLQEANYLFISSLIFHNIQSTNLIPISYIEKEQQNPDSRFKIQSNSISLEDQAHIFEVANDKFLDLVFLPKKLEDEFGTYYLIHLQKNNESYQKVFQSTYNYINKPTTIKNFKNNTLFSYFYFNSSEQPNNISNKEWSKREKDWDLVLGDSNSFSFIGLTKKMVHNKVHDHFYFSSNSEKNDILKNKLSEKFHLLNKNKELQLKSITFELFFNGIYSTFLTKDNPRPSDILKTYNQIDNDELPPIYKQKYLEIYQFCKNNYLSLDSEKEINLTFKECLEKVKIQSSYLDLQDSFAENSTRSTKKNKI